MPPPTAQTDAAEPRAERARLAAGLRLLDRPEAAFAATIIALVGSAAFLLVRIVPDVSGKPLFDDEVVAGLTAVHPFGELLDIVIFDRGGAPLHFVLAHVALWFDASPESLRWLSIVFAVATIPVCWNLGRRLGGPVAGTVAAIVAGTSSMLAVYGSVGRMYAIFAFASAVAIDLFVRALDLRTPRAAFWAALAALFLPAVHPYGLVVVAVEAGVALAIWRGRPLKPALPILALAALLTPFVIADMRLSERFGVTASGDGSVAPPDFAARQLGEALQAFAGGAGILALLFFGLALAGLFVVFRSRPAVAVFAALVLAAVPVLMVLARAESELVHQLTPRHLMFGLPLWAALVGVGVARLVRGLPPAAVAAAVGAVALAGALAPAGISDPRDDPERNGDPARGAGRLGARPRRGRLAPPLLLPGLPRGAARRRTRDGDAALRPAARNGRAGRLPGAVARPRPAPGWDDRPQPAARDAHRPRERGRRLPGLGRLRGARAVRRLARGADRSARRAPRRAHGVDGPHAALPPRRPQRARHRHATRSASSATRARATCCRARARPNRSRSCGAGRARPRRCRAAAPRRRAGADRGTPRRARR